MASLLDRALNLHRAGRLQDASMAYLQLLAEDSRHADALHMLGVIALQAHQPQISVDYISRAIAVDPRYAPAYCNRASAWRALGDFEAALRDYEQALMLNPQDAALHHGRAVALAELLRLDEALGSVERSIAIRRDSCEAHALRAQLCLRLDRLNEALGSFDAALSLRADAAELWHSRGVTQLALNRVPEALESFANALAHRPEFAEAHWSRAAALLLLGELPEGFKELEWRHRTQRRLQVAAAMPSPAETWLGSGQLAGRRILVRGEQGLGDMIQFCRYVPLLADAGATVLLEADHRLTRMLKGLSGVHEVLAAGGSLPPHDLQIPVMSLPLAFATTLSTVPARPHYLRAPADLLQDWRERLGTQPKPRVGLAWRGSPRNGNDRYRSIALAELLSALPRECRYVSLQIDLLPDEVQCLGGNGNVLHFGADLGDFARTAALLECLDVIVSVDSSMAHLAAAVGRPTWILLPFAPDWRWLLDRSDSPWYPSARLYRQVRRLEWSEPLAAVSQDLRALLGDVQMAGGQPVAAAGVHEREGLFEHAGEALGVEQPRG